MRALFCRGLTLEVSLLRAEEIKPKVLSERLRKVTAFGTVLATSSPNCGI